MVSNLELTIGFSALGVGYAVLVNYVSSRNQEALREFFTKQNIPISSSSIDVAHFRYDGEKKIIDVTLDNCVYQIQVDPGFIDTPLAILEQWKR